METLEKTGYVKPQASTDLDYSAAGYKCDRSLPLADCYVLALAKKTRGTATFAMKESDLAKEEGKRPFDVDLFFLQDVVEKPDWKGSRKISGRLKGWKEEEHRADKMLRELVR